MEVRTRIAPSPTGYPHIGTIYQAMFDFVFAKKYSGKFILRIEDTDQNRLVTDAEKVIFDSFDWFGLTSDEDPNKGGEFAPYRQSERLEIYMKYAQELIEKGSAYYCFCTKERLDDLRIEQQQKKQPPMYDKKCFDLSPEEVDKKLSEKIANVIRLNVPKDEKITVMDAIAGIVTFDSAQIDDQVLIKSDGFPTYHLAVVVDDFLMKITHVFRGTEWLPSTPKHVLLYKFLGWEASIPKFAHLPLLLDPEGSGKLSKRKGHASVDYYRSEGFLPEAVLNYMANVVWNHPEGQEIFPLSEFEKAFELEPFKVAVKPQGARFDLKKLEWVNGEWIRQLSDEELTKRLQEFLVDHPSEGKIAHVVPLIKERIKKLSDFIPLTDFFWEEPEYEREVFERLQVTGYRQQLEKILEKFEKMEMPWKKEEFEKTFVEFGKENRLSNSQTFQLIRVAISGQTVTPPLFESIQILGEEKTIDRFKKAIQYLTNNS